jgi:hypothetical protein
MSRFFRTAVVPVFTLLFLSGTVATAAATTVVIDDTALKGAGATWDLENNYFYGSSGPCYAVEGYNGTDDGAFVDPGIGYDNSDAFDGGLLAVINGITFNDPDENGDKSGKQITVGPQNISGLRVSRVERAFKTSPTLRSLIVLKNPTTSPISANVLWDSAMGADDAEKTRSSSDRRFRRFTVDDLWAVASDSATTISDPAVTYVVAGPGTPAEPPAAILNAPETPDAENTGPNPDSAGCVTIKYRVRVDARSTSYLLFFTQMHGSNESAAAAAQRFTNIKPGNALFDGLSPRVRRSILNFDLA